jgi:AhpD family alkylhydroperoxidase
LAEPRLKYYQAAPDGYRTLRALQEYVNDCGLEPALIELVKLRASQINGCAFCVDMHWKDARAMGESEERLYMLSAWHEADIYSPRERAALLWTETLTLISETHAPDDVWEQVRAEFTDKEVADLSFAIVTINAWNRLAVGFRQPPGVYQPRAVREAVTYRATS